MFPLTLIDTSATSFEIPLMIRIPTQCSPSLVMVLWRSPRSPLLVPSWSSRDSHVVLSKCLHGPLDQTMSFNHHITMYTGHLSITWGTWEKWTINLLKPPLVHAFVSSRLDYCNALLIGLSKYQINKLQLVLNTAARVVTYTPKIDHITPVLCKLHWPQYVSE